MVEIVMNEAVNKILPLSAMSPDDTKMELGCGSAKMVLIYFEKLYGQQKLEEFVFSTNMNLDYIQNHNNWMSYDYYCRLLARLVEYTGNPRAPYDAGACSIERKAFGCVEHLIARLGTVKSTYRLVVLSSLLWDKLSDWQFTSAGRGRCVISIKNRKYAQDKNNCLSIQGVMAAFPVLHGLPSAQVKELQCACDGADRCEYDISWVANTNYLWSWLMGATGLLVATGFALFGTASQETEVFLVLLVIATTLLGRLMDSQKQLKKVYKNNEAQAASLQESMRYVESLNLDLQQKVESRTEALMKANESLQVALAEQKKSEQKAIRAERQAAVGVLAAGMAHEINNPVNAIRISIQTLLAKVDNTSPMYSLLDNAFKATSRCTRIVNDLLTFARKEQAVDRVNIRDVLTRSVEIFKKEDTGEVDVHIEIADDIPMVEVDAQQMQQAILNLMINSGDAMKGRGKIDISLSRQGDEVVLVHQDTGSGINAEMKSRIFDPFFSTKKGGSSKGLGLSITVELVHRNNGRIDLESEEGEGARFVIRFPVENGDGE